MVGVVQAMGFLQLFGVSLSPRLLAGGFELDGFYHGLGAHAIRTWLAPPIVRGLHLQGLARQLEKPGFRERKYALRSFCQ
jgi:hypothetical protein